MNDVKFNLWGVLIDGIGGSEALDTAGERLSIAGCDITDYQRQRATAVYEHRSGNKGTALDVVGRVIYGKKLLTREDAENDRERYWWDKVKMPMIYVIVRLRDGNPAVTALKAELRGARAHKEPELLGFSVEGKTVSQSDNNLNSTVCRDIALTYKPANRTSGGAEILQDDEAPGAIMTKSEVESWLGDLLKTTEAGFGDVPASTAVQGAALTKDDTPKQPPNQKAGQIRIMSDAKPGAPPAPVQRTPKVGGTHRDSSGDSGILTVRGEPVQPNPDLDEVRFDEHKGILHTPEGSFAAYLPEHDNTGDQYNQLLSDPKVEQFHSQAMEGWVRAHRLMRAHKLPSEVVMHGVLFSMLSPNTPVPVQELQYSKLIDSMKETGHDPRSPGFESTIDHWQGLNKQHILPQHSPEHFANHPGVHYKESGGLRASTGFHEQKARSIMAYHKYHDALTQLIGQHGHDVRTIAASLMTHKIAGEKHEARRNRAVATGKPDPGDYAPALNIFGLAPKTSRYALGMMGGGSLTVPDTHFLRHSFGLDIKKDSASIENIKRHLWNPLNHHALEGFDRWYTKNHPAVKFMANHPRWGKEFDSPEHATFPAFWRHWMTILPHESMRGMKAGQGHNEYTTHAPFWNAVDPFTKAEDLGDLPLRTALIHHQYIKHLGEVPASMLFASFLLPRLIGHGDSRLHEAFADHLLAGAAPRLEHSAVELRSSMPSNAKNEHLWPGAQIRKVEMSEHEGKPGPSIGRFMLMNGHLHHLEDYHGLLSKALPEGPIDAGGVARLHALEASPNLRVSLHHELPVEPGDEPESTVPAEPDPAAEEQDGQGISTSVPPATEAYKYKRVGTERTAILEVSGDQAYLDGTPIPGSMVELMMMNVERGIAQLEPVGLSKAEFQLDDELQPLEKSTMEPDEAMQHIRAAVKAGHVHPDVEKAMTHHVYNDPKLPGIPIGNAYAYAQFLKTPKPGVHVALDLNDFSHVNNNFGHHVGDDALTAYFGALRSSVDESVGRKSAKLFRNPSSYDLFRSGGDEAQIHLPSHEHAVKFAHKLREKLAALPPIGGSHRLSTSIGVGATPEEADKAMYEAKKGKLTSSGERAYAPGHTPNFMHSSIPGHVGPVHLHSEAPPPQAPVVLEDKT